MKRTSKEFFENYYEATSYKHHLSYDEREELRLRLFKEWYDEMEVGDHCHICHWTDVSPCTVIKRTPTTITVRHDKATRRPEWKPEWVIGGFSAHCTNNDDQENAWIIEEDPNGYTEVFRWSKRINAYKNASDEKLSPEWAKFHDYNF